MRVHIFMVIASMIIHIFSYIRITSRTQAITNFIFNTFVLDFKNKKRM